MCSPDPPMHYSYKLCMFISGRQVMKTPVSGISYGGYQALVIG